MEVTHTNLYIVEEEYTEEQKKFSSILETAEQIISDYGTIMKSIQEEEVMKGSTSDNLFSFASLASDTLKNHLSNIATVLTLDMDNYIADIDKEDTISYT